MASFPTVIIVHYNYIDAIIDYEFYKLHQCGEVVADGLSALPFHHQQHCNKHDSLQYNVFLLSCFISHLLTLSMVYLARSTMPSVGFTNMDTVPLPRPLKNPSTPSFTAPVAGLTKMSVVPLKIPYNKYCSFSIHHRDLVH